MNHKPFRFAELNPVDEDLVLPNGVFVEQGKNMPIEIFQSVAKKLGHSPEDIEKGYNKPVPPDQSTKDVLLGELNSYGISPVTDRPLNSHAFSDCLCMINTGRKMIDAALPQLGILTHFVPEMPSFLKVSFQKDINRRIGELQNLTQEGTRCTFIGGGYLDVSSQTSLNEYIQSVEDLVKTASPLNGEIFYSQPSIEDRHRFFSLDTQQNKVLARSRTQPTVALHPAEFPPVVPAENFLKNLIRLWKSLGGK
jgi:hypothetical protein